MKKFPPVLVWLQWYSLLSQHSIHDFEEILVSCSSFFFFFFFLISAVMFATSLWHRLIEPHLIISNSQFQSSCLLQLVAEGMCQILSWFCVFSATRCLGMNLAETSCMPKVFKIVAHDRENMTMSSATFYIVSHRCACTKAMTASIFSTMTNADGQVIMIIIFLQFLATFNLQPLCILHIQDRHTATFRELYFIYLVKKYIYWIF